MDESKQLVELLSGTAMLLKSIADPCLADQLATKQLQIVKQKLESPSLAIDAETAMTLNSQIDAMSGWTQEARNALQSVVSNRAAATMSLPVMSQTYGRRQAQDFTNLMHYLPSSIWAKLQESSHNFKTRIEILGKFAAILGLTCPNEQTYAAALSILHLAAPGTNPELSSSQKFELLKSFKPVFKKVLERHDNHSTMTLAKLPIDLSSAAEHPLIKAAFTDEQPMQCPLQEDQLNAFAASIPLRVTNIASSSFRPFQRAASSDQIGHHLLFSSMHRNSSLMPDEIPMRYFLPPFGSSAASISTHGTPPLALTYPVENREATLSSPAILDKPNPPAVPTEPLTTPGLAHTEASVTHGEKTAGATELPAAHSEDPLAVIAGLQSKRAEAKASAKEARSTPEEVEAKKRPASAPSRSRKAASKGVSNTKQSSSCKTVPKKNTKAVKKAAARSPAASLSMAKRLSIRPSGCSKCRWKPGCTPSCLRGVLRSMHSDEFIYERFAILYVA